jgi:hypothetical protein
MPLMDTDVTVFARPSVFWNVKPLLSQATTAAPPAPRRADVIPKLAAAAATTAAAVATTIVAKVALRMRGTKAGDAQCVARLHAIEVRSP